MRIADIPKDNRPRERFLKLGPEALSDSELFAILLRTGSGGENVIDMSNRLIAQYGLENLFQCSLKELQEIKGIGPSKAMQILVMNEIQKRISQAQKPIKKISCAEDVFNLYKDKLGNEKQEHFYVLMLNNQNNIIGEKEISKGILDAAIIDPREVFKPAIRNSAAKIILIHNHPSGNPEPSGEDLSVTEKIIDSGKTIGIKVIDHIIVGRKKWWGWNERKIF